jgi:hypothetical protein
VQQEGVDGDGDGQRDQKGRDDAEKPVEGEGAWPVPVELVRRLDDDEAREDEEDRHRDRAEAEREDTVPPTVRRQVVAEVPDHHHGRQHEAQPAKVAVPGAGNRRTGGEMRSFRRRCRHATQWTKLLRLGAIPGSARRIPAHAEECIMAEVCTSPECLKAAPFRLGLRPTCSLPRRRHRARKWLLRFQRSGRSLRWRRGQRGNGLAAHLPGITGPGNAAGPRASASFRRQQEWSEVWKLD